MKLLNLKRGDKIKVEEGLITFDHLDGMYSYCTADWIPEGSPNVVHLSAVTPLEKVGLYYEIQDEKKITKE